MLKRECTFGLIEQDGFQPYYPAASNLALDPARTIIPHFIYSFFSYLAPKVNGSYDLTQ